MEQRRRLYVLAHDEGLVQVCGFYLESFFGSADIGLFSVAVGRFAIAPPELTAKKRKSLASELDVQVISTAIGGSPIVGVFASGNSHGVLLPHLCLDDEHQIISSAMEDVNILVLRSKNTALGNLVLTNDFGAIVSPEFTGKEASEIGDALGVEVVRSSLADRTYVGSIAVATNLGVLVHVDATEENVGLLENVLKVPVYPGTVNGGVQFVRSGIIANARGAAVGSRTTGPEMVAISRALDIL